MDYKEITNDTLANVTAGHNSETIAPSETKSVAYYSGDGMKIVLPEEAFLESSGPIVVSITP